MRSERLWQRIATYPFPADSAGRSFEEQLRQEQNISVATARRGIEEYRRFLYLCALNEGRSVPSKAVDAVWHLHLSHTKDYWERFVPEVLDGKPIHHTPGAPEGHRSDYQRTRERYRIEFGEDPAKGIWPERSIGGHIFGLLFISFWLFCALQGLGDPEVPQVGVWLFLLIGAGLWLTVLASILQETGYSIGFEVDIWSDSEGGDCGDCGGGCGD